MRALGAVGAVLCLCLFPLSSPRLRDPDPVRMPTRAVLAEPRGCGGSLFAAPTLALALRGGGGPEEPELTEEELEKLRVEMDKLR
jgi:hypothetical protein